MSNGIDHIAKEFVLPKIKFAGTSAVATLVDYVLYLMLVEVAGLPKVTSNIISSGLGMIINFVLQKRFIFDLRRKVSTAFLISLAFSIGGIALGTFLIWLISLIPFFEQNQFITKLIVIGIVFFYNFYTKRFAFEKR